MVGVKLGTRKPRKGLPVGDIKSNLFSTGDLLTSLNVMHPLTKYIRESQSRQGPAGSSEARQISMPGNEVHFLKTEHAI